MEISKGFLVHFIMTSLPQQFRPLKINYNTKKDKWKISGTICHVCSRRREAESGKA